jgi:hypothetical protein
MPTLSNREMEKFLFFYGTIRYLSTKAHMGNVHQIDVEGGGEKTICDGDDVERTRERVSFFHQINF